VLLLLSIRILLRLLLLLDVARVPCDGRAEEVLVDEARREERLDLLDREVGVEAVRNREREGTARRRGESVRDPGSGSRSSTPTQRAEERAATVREDAPERRLDPREHDPLRLALPALERLLNADLPLPLLLALPPSRSHTRSLSLTSPAHPHPHPQARPPGRRRRERPSGEPAVERPGGERARERELGAEVQDRVLVHGRELGRRGRC